MDPNRNETIGCMNKFDDCMIAYTDYHKMIEIKFKNEFMQEKPKYGKKVYSRALVLDIHGQTHVEDWIELGYILSREELNSPNLNPLTMKSSIHNLISQGRNTMENIIRGLFLQTNLPLPLVY